MGTAFAMGSLRRGLAPGRDALSRLISIAAPGAAAAPPGPPGCRRLAISAGAGENGDGGGRGSGSDAPVHFWTLSEASRALQEGRITARCVASPLSRPFPP